MGVGNNVCHNGMSCRVRMDVCNDGICEQQRARVRRPTGHLYSLASLLCEAGLRRRRVCAVGHV
jgi:hypothetical protein